VLFTVQTECKRFQSDKKNLELTSLRLCDYHTILESRKVNGKPNENPVQSYRWYLFDTPFTVAVEEAINAPIKLEEIAGAVHSPIYTPFLGRRSCPLSRPLLDPDEKPVEAKSAIDVLQNSDLGGSVIYSESPELVTEHKLRMRDVPLYGRVRRFTTREVFIHAVKEVSNVPE